VTILTVTILDIHSGVSSQLQLVEIVNRHQDYLLEKS